MVATGPQSGPHGPAFNQLREQSLIYMPVSNFEISTHYDLNPLTMLQHLCMFRGHTNSLLAFVLSVHQNKPIDPEPGKIA